MVQSLRQNRTGGTYVIFFYPLSSAVISSFPGERWRDYTSRQTPAYDSALFFDTAPVNCHESHRPTQESDGGPSSPSSERGGETKDQNSNVTRKTAKPPRLVGLREQKRRKREVVHSIKPGGNPPPILDATPQCRTERHTVRPTVDPLHDTTLHPAIRAQVCRRQHNKL